MVCKYRVVKSFLLKNSVNNLLVKGNSMYPLFTDGERVKIIPLKNSLIPGRCYIFVCNNSLLIHRLLMIKRDSVYFIGDNSQKIDIVSKEAVIAEPESNQNYLVILLLRYINMFFISAIKISSWSSQLRVKIIYLIDSLERFFYERKIHKTRY